MVGVHLVLPVDARLVGVAAERAQRAVRLADGLRILSLLLVADALRLVVVEPDIEQLRNAITAVAAVPAVCWRSRFSVST